MGAFTDATDQLFKDLYKEVDDYFNAIADAALKEDKDTWGDLNNFHYAASMAWQVQGIVATIGDEMKNQEKNRTDLGLWVGPAADVYGSAMKTLITFVERINTALQPVHYQLTFTPDANDNGPGYADFTTGRRHTTG